MKIYAAYWDDFGPVKIGISRTPSRRLADLQVACPYKLKMESFDCSEEYQAADKESDVHRTLSSQRMSGEWFDITVREATEAIRDAGPMKFYDVDFEKIICDFLQAQVDAMEHQKLYHREGVSHATA